MSGTRVPERRRNPACRSGHCPACRSDWNCWGTGLVGRPLPGMNPSGKGLVPSQLRNRGKSPEVPLNAAGTCALFLGIVTKKGYKKVGALSSWQARRYVQKKAAPKGGLSLGRKRPKRRMQHRCCDIEVTRNRNSINGKGRSSDLPFAICMPAHPLTGMRRAPRHGYPFRKVASGTEHFEPRLLPVAISRARYATKLLSDQLFSPCLYRSNDGGWRDTPIYP